ncbi:MAG: RNA-guided pseudouridylation complex pseudouridine synthase subunit Cbf5 [Candidatus Thalassarchaeaceae archaeon]
MTSRIVIDESPAKTSRHGKIPSERGLEALMEAGVILVDKPPGPSSHQLASWARDILGLKRLGHGGTLDPFATGALTLLLGKATRLTEVVLSGNKTYIAVLKIDSSISSRQVEEVLERFSGEIYNVPPLESAVKIRVRTRTIQEIKLLESDQEDGLHTVSVSCQAGTYIRTLARDIGLMLGTPCVLSELHRHSTGSFEQSSLCTMQQLADAAMLAEEGDEESLCRLIAPVERILGSIPGVWVRDSAIASICHGAPLAVPGVVSLDSGMSAGDKTVIWSAKGEAIAVGEMIVDSSDVPNMTEGELVKPKIVLMDKDEYPGAWSGR